MFPRVLQPLLMCVGATHVRFAAVRLPRPPMAPAAFERGDDDANDRRANLLDFRLWGLTLSLLSDVQRRASIPPLVGRGAPPQFTHQYGMAGVTWADTVLRMLRSLRWRQRELRFATGCVSAAFVAGAVLHLARRAALRMPS